MVDENRVLVGWKIWYKSGTVLNSKNNKWTECKQNEVEVVKLFYINSDGSQDVSIHHGQELYILNDLLDIPKTIKIGKSMEGEEFWDLFDKATKEDKEFVEELI